MSHPEDSKITEFAPWLQSRGEKSPYLPDSPFYPDIHSSSEKSFSLSVVSYQDEGITPGSSFRAGIEAIKMIKRQDYDSLIISSGFSSFTSQGRIVGASEVESHNLVRYNPFISPFSHEVFLALGMDFSEDVAISILIKYLVNDLGWDKRAAILYLSIYMDSDPLRIEKGYEQRFHRHDGEEYIKKSLSVARSLSRAIFALTANRYLTGETLVVCSITEASILGFGESSGPPVISRPEAVYLLRSIRNRDSILAKYILLY